MHYFALACDYDGTLAHHGVVAKETIAALERVRNSGRKLLMVTGRELPDLKHIFPALELFDCVVAENGALLYLPKTRQETSLCEGPSRDFVQRLTQKGVQPLSVGHCIVATHEPYEKLVLETIQETGLELQVIFNKGAVMILPSGINKGTGLARATREIGLSLRNIVGVGDAENDHAFLAACECSVAVGNALDTLKERADIVTLGENGAGVRELIGALLGSDLTQLGIPAQRRGILLGNDVKGSAVNLPPYGSCILIAGPSGSGKSTVATAIVERLYECGYQFCLLDPEGDFEAFLDSISVGNQQQKPDLQEFVHLLENFDNTVVNLLGVPLADRPEMFAACLARVQELRARIGRPQWLIVDEAHHVLPHSWRPDAITAPQVLDSSILITVHPDHLSGAVLESVDTILAVGNEPQKTIAAFCSSIDESLPPVPADWKLDELEVVAWFRRKEGGPMRVRVEPGTAERRRHRRKYALGDIHENSFYFRGPEGKLNLRAQNLTMFVQMAEGVDDSTWMHHLQQGDYSRWVRDAIKDEQLGSEIREIEVAGLSPQESRARIKEAIERQYTSAA
jgi:HAD superfamily hydrolase (TIGR01484 family)